MDTTKAILVTQMAKMAGNNYSVLFLTGMSGLVLLQNQSCFQEKTPATSAANAVVVADLLSDVGPKVVIPTLDRFISQMETLQVSLVELESSTADASSYALARTESQNQWLSAMLIWQELEVMQVGPAGSSLKFIAGQDIRDEIYSWPTVNPCRIDQKTVEQDWKDLGYFDANLVNSYGMDALEHLLYADADSVCPSQVVPLSDGSWSALGESGIALNRAQFSDVLVDNIIVRASELRQIWSANGGNFSELLIVSDDASPYESRNQALNAVFDSLFYLETATKDAKLALPLGLRDCGEDLCLDDLEGLQSDRSLASVVSNLRGFSTLFSGGDGMGMDDLLIELGHEDLSIQILADVDAAISLADTISDPLHIAIEDDYDSVMSFYEALAKVTTAMKQDLSLVLSMEIPSEAAGDND
jgi:predicted lipoprotein